MRRIVIVGGGLAAAKLAARVRRMTENAEVNLVVPVTGKDSKGVFGRYAKSRKASQELMKTRDVGVLETAELDFDFEKREVQVSSQRGWLPMRFDQLVLEIDAVPRVPRALRRSANVVPWPVGDVAALDGILEDLKPAQCVVVGGGRQAMELAGLLLACNISVRWVRTAAAEAPLLDADMWFHVDRLAAEHGGDKLQMTDWSDYRLEQLATVADQDGLLGSVDSPDGRSVSGDLFFWADPQRAVHPLLANDGIDLAEDGLLAVDENYMTGIPDVYAIGSAVSVKRPFKSLMPSVAGQETAFAMARRVADTLAGMQVQAEAMLTPVVQAFPGGKVFKAGMCLSEAAAADIDAEFAMLFSKPEGVEENSGVAVKLVVEKASSRVLGVQAVAGSCSGWSDGFVTAGALAIAGNLSVDALAALDLPGETGRILNTAACIVTNKLQGKVYGISPEELVASRSAGAEFFTLDLRAQPVWKKGHLEGAHNIPLPQLKERLQDEVPRFTPLVIVSQNSNDAWSVACYLAGLGAGHVYVLDGGMDMWPYEVHA
ncbi:FAD-dependent oxidoreductase [Oleidesulfovibrio sp.]|uniref:FAD-dependent oxidoreductase n=1 Tax=Oleidesulfovibrio sp. TaxID=2909707 RepID=UPI003A83B7A0